MGKSSLRKKSRPLALESLEHRQLLATLTVGSSRDNTLIEDPQGDISNGVGPSFFVGRTAPRDGTLRRGVVAFNVSAIPSNAVVTAVRLSLNMSKTIVGTESIALHRLTRTWGEGTSSDSGGMGSPATTGDATWLFSSFSSQRWTSAGGDFVATASAATNVGSVGSYSWSSATMVRDVQGWVSNPATNFGWIVIGDELNGTSAKRFDTRENPSAASRPSLVVTYDIVTNQPPRTAADAAATEFEIPVTIDVLANDTDPDGDPLTLASVTPPAAQVGTAAIVNARLVFTPAAGFFGQATLEYGVSDGRGGTAAGQAVVTVRPPRVVSSSFTHSGVDLQLSFTPDLTRLNLYSGQTAGNAPADVTLAGIQTGPVTGSLVWNPSQKILSFIKTGGPLAEDTYTLSAFGRADGLVTVGGIAMDGDNNGPAGGTFTTTLNETIVPGARVVRMGDIVRGPGQPVALAGSQGIPISIQSATGVAQFLFRLVYDPTLLTVSAAVAGAGLPGTWTVDQSNVATPGVVTFAARGPALPASSLELVRLTASIPTGATYGATSRLRFETITLNSGAIVGIGDEALQVVAYFGDSSADRLYTGLDASLIARVSVGLETGFDNFPRVDPLLIGDVTGSGFLSGLDASFVARKAINLPQPEIPDLPAPPPPESLVVDSAAAPVVSPSSSTAMLKTSKRKLATARVLAQEYDWRSAWIVDSLRRANR